MDVTRRTLARMLAAVAAVPALATAQSNSDTDPDLKSARDRMTNEASQLAKVVLPMAVEPACQFKA